MAWLTPKVRNLLGIALASLVAWFAFKVVPSPEPSSSEWAAWVQAVGSVAAIAAGFAALFMQNQWAEQRAEREKQALRVWMSLTAMASLATMKEAIEQLTLLEGHRARGELAGTPTIHVPILNIIEEQLVAVPVASLNDPFRAMALSELRSAVRQFLLKVDTAEGKFGEGVSMGDAIAGMEDVTKRVQAVIDWLGGTEWFMHMTWLRTLS